MKTLTFHNLLYLLLLFVFSACGSHQDLACKQQRKRNYKTETTAKVLLIGIDGCRSDALKSAKTPIIDQLLPNSAYSYVAERGPHTVSGPGWSNMLTGVWSDKHKVTSNNFKRNHYKEHPHFFNRLLAYEQCLRLASVVRYLPLHKYLLQEEVPKHRRLTDGGISRKAGRLIKRKAPDALFVHFDQVDHVGHSKGFHPDILEYVEQIEKTDKRIAKLLKAIEKRKKSHKEDWLIVISTDHGGTKDGEHGDRDNFPEVTKIPLIIHGKGVKPGRISPAPTIVDIVPTILMHLGIPIDPAWDLDGKRVGGR